VNQKETDLLKACCKGSRESQEALYKHFYSFAMSVCLRYAPNRDDAMEIMNDSFMKVFQNIKAYDASKPFRFWFRRILVNTALDHYRSNNRYRLQTTAEDDFPESVSEPDYYQKLSAQQILALFASIPEIYRITFNLYEIEGYSHDEISTMLKISPGTSRSNLSRAKKMLQRLYQEQKNQECHEAV
jgi:RNA polymerase sigma factor (sigma-70 family)